jgi:hypothetical protein
MNRALGLAGWLLLAAAPAAAAEGPPAGRSAEALAILAKADAAIKAVDAVSCRVSLAASGVALDFVTPAEGRSVMAGWAEDLQMPGRFFARVTFRPKEPAEPFEVTAGGDGTSYFVVDHKTKRGYEDMDPGVMGAHGRTLRNFGMVEFVHPRPFDDELNAEALAYEGLETVGGEACHKIHVVYAGGQGESTWYFSKADLLPRRRTRHFEIPNRGKGAVDITVSELRIAPELEPSLFKMKLPAGYERVDDFAP